MNIGFVATRRLALLGVALAWCGVLGISVASAETAVVRPYQVTWPTGWEVSYLPSAATNSGKNLGGERVRVLLKAEGVAVVAAIELTYFPRSDKGQAKLTEEFDQLRSQIQAAYEQQKFKVNLTSTRALMMGGQSALTTELSVVGDNAHLMQWMGVALSPQFLYSLTFTVREENFARYRPQFDAVTRSMALK